MPIDHKGWKKVNSMTDETWDRQKPIQGLLVEKKTNIGPNKSNLYVLEVDGKTWGVWGGTVLDARFESIQINEEVIIEPLGVSKGKNGKEFNNYDVFTRPAPFKKVDDEVVTANGDEVSKEDIAEAFPDKE